MTSTRPTARCTEYLLGTTVCAFTVSSAMWYRQYLGYSGQPNPTDSPKTGHPIRDPIKHSPLVDKGGGFSSRALPLDPPFYLILYLLSICLLKYPRVDPGCNARIQRLFACLGDSPSLEKQLELDRNGESNSPPRNNDTWRRVRGLVPLSIS